MPANKVNLTTLQKQEKTSNGLSTVTSKKKKRSCNKHKRHCRQYLQLHSEYRSTYTWHEYTGPQEHTVVRRAPQPPPTSTKQASTKLQSAKSIEDDNSEGPTLEPPLPRRKKCPELAYKTHEFITVADGGGMDAVDSNVVAERVGFAWPKRAQLTNGEAVHPAGTGINSTAAGPPRKSLSMGALKQGIAPTGPAPVHKKRLGDVDHKRDGVQASELEPLVGSDHVDGVVLEGDEREEDPSELKVAFRIKKTAAAKTLIGEDPRPAEPSAFPTADVLELRKLADEYKHRDWGSGLTAAEEASLWKRVSSNHALDALSLARSVTKEEKEKENTRKVAPTATMPPAGRPSSVQARPIHGIPQDELKADNEKAIARARKDFLIRHHLDRTTGIGDGALLPSPTREKLEPVIPRKREDTKERDEIQPRSKSSPKNSPRTGRSQSLGPSRSPKRQTIRAPSVTKEIKEKEGKEKEHKEEPERHPRPTFLATTAPPHRPNHHAKPVITSTASSTVKPPVKHSVHSTVHHNPSQPQPQPPPPSSSSSSSTTAAAARPDRVKHVVNEAGEPTDQAAAASKSSSESRNALRAAQAMTGEPQVNGDTTTGDTTSSIASTPPSQTTAPAVAQSPWIDDEPVVKSPPEPTRVKSPEQMIIRSPEPVNWTVPLDTGKTFTVTQNVREEPLTRPHSEAKSWAPSSVPSAPQSAPQSAPPELAAQHKSHHSQHSGYKSPESESVSLGSFTGLNGHKDLDSERDSPLPSNVIQPNLTHADKGSVDADDEQRGTEPSVKPVAGTNLRCLEDPDFEYERKRGDVPLTAATSSIPQEQQPQQQQQQQQQQQGSGYRILEAEPLQATSTTAPGAAQRSVASDVLEKARNRFDKFWGKGPEN